MRATARQIAELVGGEMVGNPDEPVSGVNSLSHAQPGDLSFLANRKYYKDLATTKACVILCSQDVDELPGKTLIRMKNPYLGFAACMRFAYPRQRDGIGVHECACVAGSATLGKDVNVYPGAVVGENAVVGDHVDILPGCVVGDRARIGADTLLYANVTVYHDCVIGERVIVHSGTVIGSDGFGFATEEDGRHVKIPQVGNVVIHDDVEIGANCAVDRAVMGSTIIGEGAKLDNLVQLGHNVEIGKHSFVVSQVGISGSSKVGNRVILAGQVGIVGHVKLGDRCIIGAQAGVSNDVPDGEVMLGSPARPMMDTKRILAAEAKLPKLRKQVAALERRLAKLENGKG